MQKLSPWREKEEENSLTEHLPTPSEGKGKTRPWMRGKK